jgi:hypothetical protein
MKKVLLTLVLLVGAASVWVNVRAYPENGAVSRTKLETPDPDACPEFRPPCTICVTSGTCLNDTCSYPHTVQVLPAGVAIQRADSVKMATGTRYINAATRS